jgi:hypothetical protein
VGHSRRARRLRREFAVVGGSGRLSSGAGSVLDILRRGRGGTVRGRAGLGRLARMKLIATSATPANTIAYSTRLEPCRGAATRSARGTRRVSPAAGCSTASSGGRWPEARSMRGTAGARGREIGRVDTRTTGCPPGRERGGRRRRCGVARRTEGVDAPRGRLAARLGPGTDEWLVAREGAERGGLACMGGRTGDAAGA